MNKVLIEENLIRTSELAIAATLICFDFPLNHLEPIDSQRLSFVFQITEEKKSKVDEIIRDFWADNLQVSPKRYFYVLKELKSRIFAERRSL